MFKPIKYKNLRSKIGEPGEDSGLVTVTVPFPLKLSWKPTQYVNRVMIHPYISKEFITALGDVYDYYGLEFIKKNGLDEYGGCYNPRKSRGSDRMSVHAWALAIDYAPSLGPLWKPALTPAPIVQAFKNQGFLWGGDWDSPDGMHFTAVIE